jgi:hypothetical protein
MPAQPAPEIELLSAAYADFNARDIDVALALITPDVAWSKATVNFINHKFNHSCFYWNNTRLRRSK